MLRVLEVELEQTNNDSFMCVFLVLFRFSFYSTCIFTVTSLSHHASVVMFYTHNK